MLSAWIAWLLVCVGISVVLYARPFVLAMAGLTLWCVIPGVAGDLVTGQSDGLGGIHPASWLIVIAALVQLVLRPSWLLRSVNQRPEWAVLLGAVIVSALVLGIIAGRGSETIRAVVDQLVAPIALFFLLGSSFLEVAHRVETVRWWFLSMAAVQATLAVVQARRQSPIFFGVHYAEQTWFTDYFQRWMGTLDHPLVLSLLLVVAIPLVAGARRTVAFIALPPLYLAGLLTTQSRVGVALGTLGVLYVAVVAPMRMRWRVVYLLGGVAVFFVLLQSGSAAGVLERFSDDSGSTDGRLFAWSYFFDYIGGHWWLGGGLNSSFDVSEAAGLTNSFESALLMYAVDLGVVFATIYFGVMLIAAARAWRPGAPRGLAGASLAAVLAPQTFSALSGSTAAPSIVWTVLAMSGYYVRQRPSAAPALWDHPLVRSAHGGSADIGTAGARTPSRGASGKSQGAQWPI